MKYNYHTHTYRCGHATGTPEEYILRAIEGGITHMGFSEHAPHVFSDGHESGFRLPAAQGREYIGELRELREKYRDRIDIRIGFEMEYYPDHFQEMLETATSLGAEYLILGQHYIRYGTEGECPPVKPNDKPEDLAWYVDSLIEAMQTGVFSYLAHPDLFNFVGDEAIYEAEMRRLCKAAVRYEMPLEINFLGIRDHRIYPTERFWKIAGEEGCEVVFGCDAHKYKHAYDAESLAVAHDLVAKYNLRYNPYPTMIHPVTKEKTTTCDSTKNT